MRMLNGLKEVLKFKRYKTPAALELCLRAIFLIALIGLFASVVAGTKKTFARDLDSKTLHSLNVVDEATKKWKGAIAGLSNDAHKRAYQYKRDIKDLKELSLKKRGKYKAEARILKEQAFEKIKEYKKNVREVYKSTYQEVGLQGEDELEEIGKNNTELGIYIFVSSSMSKSNLINLLTRAKAMDASVVMRGFINNSYMQTAKYFQKIIEKTGQGISIDPELFKTYGITQVPTFVVSYGSRHDKLSGNVTLNYAISEMKSKGEVFKESKANNAIN